MHYAYFINNSVDVSMVDLDPKNKGWHTSHRQLASFAMSSSSGATLVIPMSRALFPMGYVTSPSSTLSCSWPCMLLGVDVDWSMISHASYTICNSFIPYGVGYSCMPSSITPRIASSTCGKRWSKRYLTLMPSSMTYYCVCSNALVIVAHFSSESSSRPRPFHALNKGCLLFAMRCS